MLRVSAGAIFSNALLPQLHAADAGLKSQGKKGAVIGEPTAENVGLEILAAGGNAVDAAVGAALAASVASPHNCGPGGYGGHMVIALAKSKRVTAIDFNSAAPQLARENMFGDANGGIRSNEWKHGWLAAGVPGTLAGMQLALDRYGTRPFRDAVAPAIRLARDGFVIGPGLAAALRGSEKHLLTDPASARLIQKNGRLLREGEMFRNPDLAAMLEDLAKRNSVESFYRGEIARRIAAEFEKHDGLLRLEDLVNYRAREVTPLKLEWGRFQIWTAPLTAGGMTVLEALSILKALDWRRIADASQKTHARLEALRVAWQDRLRLLGDPERAAVPVERLLSRNYANKWSREIRAAIRSRIPVSLSSEPRAQDGTVHLSSVDRQGNMVALTLTHGEGFGARVTVDGLGLTLGHGMSRFEPRPGHPNSPGPGKRPLHNMCPTVVWRDGKPVLALGGAGGRRIPNAIFDVLTRYIILGETMEDAIKAPRLHCEGGLNVQVERAWPQAEIDSLRSIGYQVQTGGSARVSAVSFDPRARECGAAVR